MTIFKKKATDTQETKKLPMTGKIRNPSQRANGFLTLAGGIIITFAKEILTLITG